MKKLPINWESDQEEPKKPKQRKPKAQAAPQSKSVDQMSDAEVMKAYQLKMSRGK